MNKRKVTRFDRYTFITVKRTTWITRCMIATLHMTFDDLIRMSSRN